MQYLIDAYVYDANIELSIARAGGLWSYHTAKTA